MSSNQQGDRTSGEYGFPVVRRGYDRAAVDAFAHDAHAEITELRRQYETLAGHYAQLQSTREAPPAEADFSALGGRAQEILRVAEEQARDLTARAGADADRLAEQTEVELRMLRDHATRRARRGPQRRARPARGPAAADRARRRRPARVGAGGGRPAAAGRPARGRRAARRGGDQGRSPRWRVLGCRRPACSPTRSRRPSPSARRPRRTASRCWPSSRPRPTTSAHGSSRPSPTPPGCTGSRPSTWPPRQPRRRGSAPRRSPRPTGSG